MSIQNFPRESSVIDAQTWISVCRAFTTLDAELQPELFDIAPSDYPATHVSFWKKDCDDQYDSLGYETLSLTEASMRIIGMPFESNDSFELLDDCLKHLLDISDKSDFVLFNARPATQLGNELLIRFSRRTWSRYSDPAISFSLDDKRTTASLLEALVKVSLKELVKVEENNDLWFDDPNALIESELLVRAACNLLCDTAEVVQINRSTIASLYGNFVNISQTPYERRSLSGNVVVTTKTMPMDITFSSQVPIEDHRAARKLFEMAAYGDSIITDGNNVFGLRQCIQNDTLVNSNEIKIRIFGYGCWSAIYDRSVLFEVINGIPRLPRPKLSRKEFERALQHFSDSSANIEKLWAVVSAATHAQHGAIVVVSRNAKDEAQRLGPQATLITPTILPNRMLPAVFAIDGALLLGLDGLCHAVGVILDGAVSERGTKSRGSRYNSAVRYVDSQTGNAIALVVSEDNYINLILPEHTA